MTESSKPPGPSKFIENSFAEIPPDADPPAGGKRKVWRVGTLTYSAAGLAALFFWLLWGDFAAGLKERAVYPMAQIMLRGFQSPDWLVGLLVGSIPAGIGMLWGPVISVMSDRHRGKWGRRIPFLIIPTPFIVLSMIGLAYTSALGGSLHALLGDGSPGLMTCRIIVFVVFWAIFDFSTIVINTLFAALINDVVPREIIGRFFSLFRAVSLIAGMIFNFYLMGIAETHFVVLFVVLGLIFGAGFVMMCLKVKEGEYGAPPPRLQGSALKRAGGNLTTYMRECFSRPFYLWIFLAYTLGCISVAPFHTFAIFHARSLGISDDYYGKCLACAYGISLVLAYPLGSLADRFHPLRVGLAAMVVYFCICVFGYFFCSTAWTFALTFVASIAVSGIYLTGTASLMQRLFPSAKFAQFASAMGVVLGLFLMIIPPLLGLFIQCVRSEYRYVFPIGILLSAASFLSYLVVLAKFQRLGGDRSYSPPGSTLQSAYSAVS